MINLFTDTRYTEGIVRLALGIEPRDALTGRATMATIDARTERIPTPFERWRTWAPGESLSDALPRLRRHVSGRFVLLYGFAGDDVQSGVVLTCRLDNGPPRARAGRLRRVVPRRVRLQLRPRSAVEDAVDPATPIGERSVAVSLFPGAGAPVDARATVIRCRLLGPPNVDGELTVLRWCRIQAIDDADGIELGWAHGDERGECLLVLGRLPSGTGFGEHIVRFVVGAQLPPPDPAAESALRRRVDPLWDLPIEDFGAGPWGADQPTASGRRFLPEHQTIDIAAVPIPIGRTTSLELSIN